MGNSSGMVRVAILLFLARLAFFALIYLALPNARWNNWDAPHFLYIAEHGYTSSGDEANFIVFPPLYPLVVRIASFLIPNYQVAAILVSNISFIIAGVIFYKLVTEQYSRRIAIVALFLLNIFPTSYFFSAPYTESLFFLLVVTALWFSHKKRWFLVGVLTGLAFLTRMPGIFLLPAMAFQVVKTRKIANFFKILFPIVICVGIYLLINKIVYGDPLAFRAILAKHWYKTLAFPWDSIAASLRVAQQGWFENERSRMVGIAEAISATLAIIGIPIVAKTVKNYSYTILYASTVIFITSTGFLLSTPRYLVAIPPLFIALAIIGTKSRIFLFLVSFIFTLFMTYFGLLFAKGMWAF